MDIRAKVEARKAELKRERELAEAAEATRRGHREEAAREVARKRLAVLDSGAEPRAPTAVAQGTLEIPGDDQIDAEVEKELNKRAINMWTKRENWNAGFLLLGGVLAIFMGGWPVGLLMIFVGIVYSARTTAKYKRELLEKLESDRGGAHS